LASEAAGKRAGESGGPGPRLFGGSFNIFAAEEAPIRRAEGAAVQAPPATTDLEELGASVRQRLGARLRQRGVQGCCALGRVLRAKDESGRGLAEAAFAAGLHEWGFSEVSPREAAALFRFLNRSGAGVLSVGALLDGLYGAMPPRRATAVRKAFDALQGSAYPPPALGRETVDAATVARCFDPKGYPDVRGADAVLAEFLDTFECLNGAVAWGDFSDYYKHLSFVVADDAVFEGRVLGAWHATLPPAAATPIELPKGAAQRFGAMQGSVIFNTSYGKASVEKTRKGSTNRTFSDLCVVTRCSRSLHAPFAFCLPGPSEAVGRSIKAKVGRRQRDSPSYRSSIQFG
jgi:hypothetical protein